MSLPYLSHKAYMQKVYGEALFSIPVNLEYGCPNRDKEGKGGCSFCPEHGARAAQIADAKSVEEQIEKALSFAKRRYKASSFALYIQAYTGTFASLLMQKKTYESLLKLYPFKALHIGTRPDCLSDATLNYLCELNESIDVVVELGVQSLHDVSLMRIQRGHDSACSLRAIERLRAKGLKVYAHVIIGLPDEDFSMWKESVQKLVLAGVDGIKFHHLHIIDKTALAREYALEPFALLSEYEYAEALIELLRYVPSHIPILRLATDTPKDELIAPIWHMAKGQFGEYIAQTMRYRGISQGDKLETQSQPCKMLQTIALKDGSVSAWSEAFRDYYHPKAGAFRHAKELFLQHAHFEERLLKRDLSLLDIGFGMGYNTFCAMAVAQMRQCHKVHIVGIDHDRVLLQQSAKSVPHEEHRQMLEALYHTARYDTAYAHVRMICQEARYALSWLNETFDIIFLDPFIESNNASLVSVEFFALLKKCLKPDGVLVTSTSFQAVISGMIEAGFSPVIVSDTHSDIKGVRASVGDTQLKAEKEPYHDSYGIWSDKEIESRHQKSAFLQHL